MVDQHQSLYDTFRWLVPTYFNLGQECCHRWANSSVDARRIAMFYETHTGTREIWTYERLANTANQLANGLTRMGVRAGDRVALITAQRPEALVAHIACYSLGAVIVPFTPNHTPQILEQRLRDAEARVAIFDNSAASLMLSKLSRYPTLKQLIGIDVQDDRVLHWHHLLLRQSNAFKAVLTRASDPAILLYEGAVGILLSHSALIGSLPAFVASQNWFPHGGDVLWSPNEWFRAQGLLQGLLPTLYFGQSMIATNETYPKAKILDMLQRYRVTSVCLPAETLIEISQLSNSLDASVPFTLRSLAITDKNLPETVLEWCRQALNVTPNETFGIREIGQILGNSHSKWPPRPGSLGKAYPGHRIALLDETGTPVKTGETGELALNRFDQHGHADPALFNTFWRQPELAKQAFEGDWFRSGLYARLDEQGYYWRQEQPGDSRPE
jgi:acetyl-CoA synthetase